MKFHESLRIIRDEHDALAAMLKSMRLLVGMGPRSDPARFFETLRAMLYYIDQYPERLHHPKETGLLFPKVVARVPTVQAAVERLDREHAKGEAAVRELQHLVQGWEFLGEARRADFVEAFDRYVVFYRDHMRIEESEILPAAEQHLSEEEWDELDRAFAQNQDPLTGKHRPPEPYAALFKRIVDHAPEPIGFGA
jgi:hemerythrin-like domain-containing protein